MTTTWVPWYDILLFFLRVGLAKIWELGTDPIAIRGSAVLRGLFVANVSITSITSSPSGLPLNPARSNAAAVPSS